MSIESVKTPFLKMSFTPDVPSGALGPNEYNDGKNVETDTRGIKKINGDVAILSQVPYRIIFATANYRTAGEFWFIVATINGKWYGISDTGITDLTPNATTYIDDEYTDSTAITASWNGDVCFICDNINPPMYLLPTGQEIRLYDYSYNDQTPNTYVWNYNTPEGWANLSAGFQRVYSAPNVGSILVAGNLTYDNAGTVFNLPNTVRWSQAFGLNQGPTTWEPTLENIANELEVPVRGPVIDGFPLNGNFYIMSYWDTVMLAPIAYTAVNAPVFGVSLVTKGRGLLNENCWAIADNVAYGLDARDIWAFNGGDFVDLGNQRVKNWFYSQLNANYTDQVFLVNNTYKNQIEIYYPDQTSIGYCNKMLSYRYDLEIWNPPRDVSQAVAGVESPRWTGNVANPATRGVVYAPGNTGNLRLIQKDTGNGFTGNNTIYSYFRRDNINYGEPYSNRIQVHRVLPEIYGTGNIVVAVGGADSVGQTPTFKPNITMAIDTSNPWIQVNQNTQRVSSVIFSSNDATNTWQITQANWQITITEDTR